MPCLRTSPERMSTSKASNRTLRVRSVASIAGAPRWPVVYHYCLSPKEYAGVPTSHLYSESCTVRTKTSANHTPTIVSQAASRQCRWAQGELFVQRLSLTESMQIRRPQRHEL